MTKEELIKKIVSEFTNNEWVDNMTGSEEMDNSIQILDDWIAKNLHKPHVSGCLPPCPQYGQKYGNKKPFCLDDNCPLRKAAS